MITRRLRAAPLAVALLLAGCGLSTGNSFEEIPSDEIMFGLDQTTTTTTTTTTTVAIEPTVTVEPTAPITLPIQTEPVEVYFVIGLQQLQRQTIQFSSPVEPLQVLARLEDGPSPELGVGLRTAVRQNLTVDFDNDRGVATVELRGSVLDRMRPVDQRVAIAQLVLTIGSLRGVGQVRFTIDGEPAEIGIPPDYTLSEPGEPLAYDDFAGLLTTGTQTDTATTTATTTPTTTPTTNTARTITPPRDPADESDTGADEEPPPNGP
jgi:hypothetical protein